MKEEYLYHATVRFYEELGDFLDESRRRVEWVEPFFGKPTVKDFIEGLGVPHTEVDLILLNGESVPFSAYLHDGDRLAVYPRFESLEIGEVVRLRPEPLRVVAFVADVHLGKLARYLRMLGFDTVWDPALSDDEMITRALEESRILLTRDLGMLKEARVTRGYFPRNSDPKEQLKEVVNRFSLREKIAPFSRCLECNGELQSVSKEEVFSSLPQDVAATFTHFTRCPSCNRLYWEGSHFDRMQELIETLIS